MAPFALHGGALDVARRLYPDAPTPWIDLSTGINPNAYPPGVMPSDAWTRLPETDALAGLESAAARRYHCPSHAAVVAAPGTQAIIQRLPHLLPGRDVRVLGQTYDEYARVYSRAGASVRPVARLADLAGAGVAVVVNPNNPDGRMIEPGQLVALATRVDALVVDEAFMDLMDPVCSVVSHLTGERMIVLRSFGKFYGLAGLRLGFAVAGATLAGEVRAALGPWAVSGPALVIGSRALSDDAWLAMMRARLVEEAARLDDLLGKAGATILGGTPLFRLVHHDRAAALFETLAAAGILTRPFADAPNALRVGLPAGRAAWHRLAAVVGCF